MSKISFIFRILIYLTNTGVLNIEGKIYNFSLVSLKKMSFDKTSMRLVTMNFENNLEFYSLTTSRNIIELHFKKFTDNVLFF